MSCGLQYGFWRGYWNAIGLRWRWYCRLPWSPPASARCWPPRTGVRPDQVVRRLLPALAGSQWQAQPSAGRFGGAAAHRPAAEPGLAWLPVNASNPKAIVFILAVLPQFLDPQRPLLLQYKARWPRPWWWSIWWSWPATPGLPPRCCACCVRRVSSARQLQLCHHVRRGGGPAGDRSERRGMSEAVPMRVWIDADACPRAAKDQVIKFAPQAQVRGAAGRRAEPVKPAFACVRLIVVPSGPDAADDHLVEHAEPGDRDLQRRATGRPAGEEGVAALDPRGREFDERNMGERLAVRNLFTDLRDQGQGGGQAAYGERDRQAFANAWTACLRGCHGRSEWPLGQPVAQRR